MSHTGMDTIGRVNVAFPIQFSVVSAIVVVILTGAYWYFSSSPKETLIFFGACVAAAGQVTASFYTARMLSETIKQNEFSANREAESLRRAEKLELAAEARDRHAMRLFTLGFGTRYNDPTMYHIRDTVRELVLHHGTDEELLELIEKKNTNVIHILNFLEEIATCHKLGLCEEDLLRDQFDAILLSIWNSLLPWIVQHRKQRRTEGIWEDVERLSKLWRK
jgi:Domain of unknown function (DUF4760)